MTRLWHLQLFLHPETFREQVHAQVTSPVRYSYGTRKTRLLAKGKRLLMETRTQSTTTTTTQPQMSRSVCVNTPTPLGRTEADFQRAALRFFFFFFFPKIVFVDTPHSGAPAVTRGFKGICARRYLCERTSDPARLPERAAENNTPPNRSLHSSGGWPITHCLLAPIAHMGLFKITISEKPTHPLELFWEWDIHTAGGGRNYKTNGGK